MGDGMNVIFCMMLLGGILAAIAQGRPEMAQHALLTGGKEAVTLCLELAGSYAFFGGILGILREGGLTDAIAAMLHRPLMHLFAFKPGEEKALPDICVNLSADMLGMGAAATPAGLSAMQTMAGVNGDGKLSDAMRMFLVMNMCSVQILPSTMIALRAQAGAASPADIVVPVWVVTGISMLTGIASCIILSKWSKLNA